MVTPYVSTIDSTSIEELQTAPGDFTTTDGEGDPALLKTYGNFYFSSHSCTQCSKYENQKL